MTILDVKSEGCAEHLNKMIVAHRYQTLSGGETLIPVVALNARRIDNDEQLGEALQAAFLETQIIEPKPDQITPWEERMKPGEKILSTFHDYVGIEYMNRSTMPGDIILLEGQAYVVCGRGFDLYEDLVPEVFSPRTFSILDDDEGAA